jgi:hypothetical protein
MSLELSLYLGLLLHLIGDYVTQSDWMANEKTKSNFPALVHSVIYSLPFLLIVNIYGFLIISITHFFIDRYRLARYLCWVKNIIGTKEFRHPFKECSATGYHESRPMWLSVWLLIIADNTLHLTINTFAIWWWL